MRLFLLLLMGTLVFSSPAIALAASEEVPKDAKRALHRLKKESGDTLTVHWDPKANTPSLLAGNLSKPSKHSPQWIAYEFLNQNKAVYGLSNARTDMKATEVNLAFRRYDPSQAATPSLQNAGLERRAGCSNERTGRRSARRGQNLSRSEEKDAEPPHAPLVFRNKSRRTRLGSLQYGQSQVGRVFC